MNVTGPMADRRVVRLDVKGGVPHVRESLSWRLATGIPHCDLVASNGAGALCLLVHDSREETTEVIRARIVRMVERLNEFHPCEPPLQIDVSFEEGSPVRRLASA